MIVERRTIIKIIRMSTINEALSMGKGLLIIFRKIE